MRKQRSMRPLINETLCVRYCTAYSREQNLFNLPAGEHQKKKKKSHIHHSRLIELQKLEHYASLFLHGFIHS